MGIHPLAPGDPYAIALRPKRVMHLYELARSAWPSLDLPRRPFLEYLKERTPGSGSLNVSRLQELYLACGCARRLPEAIRLFEKHYLARLRGRLVREGTLPALAGEIYWQLRVRLLVAEPRRLPGIAKYAGREPLLGWLVAEARREDPPPSP